MFVILVNKDIKTEFDYQALDYCKLFGGKIGDNASGSDKIKEYLGGYETVTLSSLLNDTIISFRTISIGEMKQIDESNKIICFSDGNLRPEMILSGSSINCFMTFGSRSAYMLANALKCMEIDRPVRKILPWVNVEGIKVHDNIPLGKVSSTDDTGMRSMFRLMAAGAVVIVPDISPYNDIIIDNWNGIIFRRDINTIGESDYISISKIVGSERAKTISNNAREMISLLMNVDRYKLIFKDAIDHGFDHNEPWIKVNVKDGPKLIVPKQFVDGGNSVQIPAKIGGQYRIVKPLELEQLLDYLTEIKFSCMYVFDAITSEIDEQTARRIARLLNILGKRSKKILFCMDPPVNWSMVSSKLTFIPPSEAIKQI
jgi:hypothetical protein